MFVTMGDGARLWFDVLSPEGEITEDGLLWRPTIIGVHGGPGIDSTAMADVLAPLGDVAQVLRYDQRGHGKSDRRTAAEWTMDRWADDLAELITNLGLKEPILLGTSFGARVALTCATRHPELVGGIVAAYGGARLDDGLTVEAFRSLGGERAARVAAGSAGDDEIDFAEWLTVCWPLVSRTPAGPDHLARMQRLSTHSPDLHAVHMAKDLEQRPVPGLSAVTCPVLILGGIEDPLLPPPLMTELQQALTSSKKVELVLVPGAGHPVFLDRPDLAYPAVMRFVAEMASP
jgi:pimeloyl-ACP methyl ester carboxylesterase